MGKKLWEKSLIFLLFYVILFLRKKFMAELSKPQRENLGKFFIDMARTVITVFVIGGLIPAANIPSGYIIIGYIVGISLLIIGLYFTKGD